LITLAPGGLNEFIHSQRAKVSISVLYDMDVKTWQFSAVDLHEGANQLREFTCEMLKNPESSDYRALLTTHDE
jgi:hypothetical protein